MQLSDSVSFLALALVSMNHRLVLSATTATATATRHYRETRLLRGSSYKTTRIDGDEEDERFLVASMGTDAPTSGPSFHDSDWSSSEHSGLVSTEGTSHATNRGSAPSSTHSTSSNDDENYDDYFATDAPTPTLTMEPTGATDEPTPSQTQTTDEPTTGPTASLPQTANDRVPVPRTTPDDLFELDSDNIEDDDEEESDDEVNDKYVDGGEGEVDDVVDDDEDARDVKERERSPRQPSASQRSSGLGRPLVVPDAPRVPDSLGVNNRDFISRTIVRGGGR